MKRFKVVYFGVVAVLCAVMFMGAGNKKTVSGSRTGEISSVSVTYGTSYVDTITYNREAGVAALAFAAHFKDSVSITNIVVRRYYDGKKSPPIAGDTLTNFSSKVAVTNDTTLVQAVTLAPLADQYVFFITYAGSGQGVTTPTVVYEVVKQFNK